MAEHDTTLRCAICGCMLELDVPHGDIARKLAALAGWTSGLVPHPDVPGAWLSEDICPGCSGRPRWKSWRIDVAGAAGEGVAPAPEGAGGSMKGHEDA